MPYPGIRPSSTSSLSHHLNRIFAYRVIFYAFDIFMYTLGPILVGLALSIISGMVYTFFYIIEPMMKDVQNYRISHHDADEHSLLLPIWMHKMLVIWTTFNILFNYFFCVTCRKNHPGTKNYEIVVRQLAHVTGFHYPESEGEKDAWVIEWRRKRLHRSDNPNLVIDSNMLERTTRDASQPTKRMTLPIVIGDVVEASTVPRSQYNLVPADEIFDGTATVQTTAFKPFRPGKRSHPSWMELNPYEWSYCYHSNLPKPPRSHFDHVTQCLILNLDHYCPWMFNSIGYFNYRYFVNFLIYVVIGMGYGVCLSYNSFITMDSHLFDEQKKAFNKWNESNHDSNASFQRLHPYIPLPFERMPIALSFALCVALGIAVAMILAFHIYLILTAQTTIEFHGNLMKKSQYKLRRMIFKNPYSLGPFRNFQQVWGSGFIITWLLPSTRDPEYLPVPLHGDKGMREQKRMKNFHESLSSRLAVVDNDLDV